MRHDLSSRLLSGTLNGARKSSLEQWTKEATFHGLPITSIMMHPNANGAP